MFDLYADQEVNDFIEEKIEMWDFMMASFEMNKEHCCYGGVLKYF